ncbi:MAG: hypothetical protein NXH97_21060 [Rhodobacteraceae bacterium]|nr:hypothetical protein [Paracoccaceae bacterium]
MHDPFANKYAGEMDRLPRRPMPSYAQIMLPVLAVISGLLLFFATPPLIGAETLWDYAKAGLLAFGAAFVAYGINRFAVQQGAPLAAIGSRAAMAASLISVLAVGAGLSISTFAGLTLAEVNRLQLKAYAQDQSEAIAAATTSAQDAETVLPSLQAITETLRTTAACEAQSSCFSTLGTGGRGDIFQSLNTLATRATAVTAQAEASRVASTGAREALNRLQQEFVAALDDETLSLAGQRRSAQIIAGQIAQALGDLNEATPVSLASTYADELRTPVSIPAHPEIARRLEGFLASQADQLSAVIAGQDANTVTLPPFPDQAGVTDALKMIGHFAPIAMIVAVVELIFPVVIWIYAYVALAVPIWRQEAMPAPVADESVPSAPTAAKRPRASRKKG